MVFSSYVFLFNFLAFVLAAYHLLAVVREPAARNRFRLALLLVASLWFYGWHRFDYIGLVLFSTLIDWQCGARIARAAPGARGRRGWLLVSVVVNLSLLGFFKYFDFGVEAINAALQAAGHAPIRPPIANVVLPVGISFYTFQSMSYTIDVYRGLVAPARGLLPFAAYVTLFPQLVAGPIVRYRDLAEQLESRTHSLERFASGAFLFMIGFGKKTLIANQAGVLAQSLGETVAPGLLDAWLGTLGYTVQIYFDFSGYSDMAIGLGLMFGFAFPINFDSPYKSRSITEFWRRWHISLSTWLRDYLYIPLGGNRGGALRTARNLMLTMLLGGLWHGAAWTFVAWGAWHGLWLGVERIIGRRGLWSRTPIVMQRALTFLVVMVGWLLFRAESADALRATTTAFFGFAGVGELTLRAPYPLNWPLTMTLIGLGLAFVAPNSNELAARINRPRALFAIVVFYAGVVQMLQQGFNPFLYYRF